MVVAQVCVLSLSPLLAGPQHKTTMEPLPEPPLTTAEKLRFTRYLQKDKAWVHSLWSAVL